MNTKERLFQFLDNQGCEYQHDQHPITFTARETAAADHVPARSFAKTLVVSHENGFSMVLVPANYQLDLSELRHSLGVTHLRLATEHELAELFPECELGAMPPFGNGTLFDLPVYADDLLMGEEIIAFNAGTHRDVVRMRTGDFKRLVSPMVLAVALARRH